MNILDTIAILIIVYILFILYQKSLVRKRAILIDSYRFPAKVYETIKVTYPHLKPSDVRLVIQGLRDYFHISNIAKSKMVAMPSQVVDVAWHEFILFTRPYKSFCKKALGRFLHHTPAEEMKSKTIAQDGIKRAWNIACKREKISPLSPNKLPLLFALDSMLDIPEGFKYSLDCSKVGADGSSSVGDFCAGHIGCSGDSSFSDSSFSEASSCGSSGCSGGCGGS